MEIAILAKMVRDESWTKSQREQMICISQGLMSQAETTSSVKDLRPAGTCSVCSRNSQDTKVVRKNEQGEKW